MRVRPLFTVVFVMALFVLPATAQFPGTPEYVRQQQQVEQMQQGLLYRDDNYDRSTLNGRMKQSGMPAFARNRFKPKITDKVKARLEVDGTDLLAYKNFLAMPQTGIFKLLPWKSCENVEPVREIQQACSDEQLNIEIFASGYSFRDNIHGRGVASDLDLVNSRLVPRAFGVQTILADFGDTRLDDVSLTSAGMKYIVDFEPAITVERAEEQYFAIDKGIVAEPFRYWRKVWVRANTTYGLRSIAYSLNKGLTFGKRDDVIVAFRVVRVDTDGSVTILWKELQRKKAPKLK